MSKFRGYDQQMQEWSTRLRDDLQLTPDQSSRIASSMAAEFKSLPQNILSQLRNSHVPLRARIDELSSANHFMDQIRQDHSNNPFFVRAQVVVQSYVAFLYVGDYLFVQLRKGAPPATVVGKVCRFLTDNPIRAFRNAIAHGNWCYTQDFCGLRFWAKKGSEKEEPMIEWTVEQNDLNF